MRVTKPLRWRKCFTAASFCLSASILLICVVVPVAVYQVPQMPVLLLVFVIMRPIWFLLRDEILSELCPSLVDRNSMPNDPSTTAGSIRKFAALHPSVLQGRDRVHRIEESEETDWFDRATEGFSKGAHKLQQLALL